MAVRPAQMAQRIEELCELRSISLAELCRRALLPAPNYISRMKSGEVSGKKHLPAIAKALGISIEILTTELPPPAANTELEKTLAELAHARELNGKLAEQLDSALVEIARLRQLLPQDKDTPHKELPLTGKAFKDARQPFTLEQPVETPVR